MTTTTDKQPAQPIGPYLCTVVDAGKFGLIARQLNALVLEGKRVDVIGMVPLQGGKQVGVLLRDAGWRPVPQSEPAFFEEY